LAICTGKMHAHSGSVKAWPPKRFSSTYISLR
jgi:hypothetical protein